MDDEVSIGVDIGGTKTNFAVVHQDGRILCQKIVPTEGAKGADHVMTNVVNGIQTMIERKRRLRSTARIKGVGIGSAGQIHYDRGDVAHALDAIKHWKGTPIRQIVERHFPYPVYVDNDVNVIAIAEKHFGVGRSLNHFVCLALGTGIGGAIIENGRLVRGVYGGAGELGHISVDFNGPRCVCGNYGCLELYASGTGIAAMANASVSDSHRDIAGPPVSPSSVRSDTAGHVSAKEVIDAWEREERWAADIMQVVISALSTGISSIIHTFNPQAVIIGGGVSERGAVFYKQLSDEVERRTASTMWKEVQLVPASMGTHAGVIGAAAQNWFYNKL